MTIVRVRATPGGTDQYGDPLPSTEDREPLPGAFTAPRESSDIEDRGREGVIVGLTLYAPHGSDVLHTDQIEVDGVLYDVDGEVGSWEHPMSGWKPGITAALSRATG